MSVHFSLSTGNEHYSQLTPQGSMLRELLELIPKTKDLWYADTFSLPEFGTLKQYYTGTVVLYCWWDPADDRISNQIDNMDLDFIIITSDPELLPVHPRIHPIKWEKQYGFHMELIRTEPWYELEDRREFLCMMRNHKPERLMFLEELWKRDLIRENFISYLGQVNTKDIHGRTSRPIAEIVSQQYQADTDFTYIPGAEFAGWLRDNIPILLPDDQTSTNENNTDFFTTGNPDWYAWTKYSIVLETYWARTQFLTEKSFKPIVAQHPFVNLGNNSNQLLESLGFDVFPELGCDMYDGMLTQKKVEYVVKETCVETCVEFDPGRVKHNYQQGFNLLDQARAEQKHIAKIVKDIL